MLRLVTTLLLMVLMGTAAGAKPSESERFNKWLDAGWEETLLREPFLATFIGDPRYNDRIVNTTTAAWRADNRRFLKRRLGQLQRFNRAALSKPDRLSYDILKRNIEESLEAERFPHWMQPVDQFDGFHLFLAQLGGGTSVQPFKTVKDYDDWYARLTGGVPILDGLLGNMRIGLSKGVTHPKVVMTKVLPQLATLAADEPEQSVFWGPIKNFPDSIPAADRERLTAAFRALIKDQVAPAYRRLHDFVRDEYVPRTRLTTAWSALPNGKAWYAFKVRQQTTTLLTPDQIHAMGQQEVSRVFEGMQRVRREVGFDGDLKAFFQHLRNDARYYPTSAEAVLGAYRNLQTKIDASLPRLFDIAPMANYQVRETEAFRAESAAAAEYWPPSADGARPAVFYVNVAELRAQPLYRMETLSLHEASPGHHFQTAIAQEMTSLPKFRRFGTWYVAYGEGWALYAETLGKELGLFTDPLQWFGHLDDQQLRAMRLVVDTGLHHKGWSRQQAIDYMLSNSSMSEVEAVREVERYIVWPGQALGYKIGQLEIRRLRSEAERALGPKFDVKKFHRVVLSDGALPMTVLASKVREWVVAQNMSR